MCVVLSLDAPLDPQHLSKAVFVAMANFKLLPRLPVGLGDPGVTHLGAMTEYCASTLQLTKLGFKLSIFETHFPARQGKMNIITYQVEKKEKM